ncbi:hypothetical protein ACEPPN_008197 [Leptodophora sp. 'Broadleaf-Isolate-01']
MASGVSAMLCCLKLSRLGSGSSPTAAPNPLYSPLSSVRSRQKPFSKQKSLAVPRDLIRLLKILPGSAPSIVECELVVVRLDKAPPYEALSYVWGNPELLDYVVCNGQRKSVTTNLGIALKHLRLRDETRLIWVDALCINQEDVDERSSQIKLMRDIYTQTWRVVVWLGEDPDGKAEGAISLLEMAAGECSRQLQLPIDEIALKDLLKIPVIVPSYESLVEASLGQMSSRLTEEIERNIGAAAWLCSHSWFERIWVVQEVAFAPAVMHIGAKEIPWKTVAVAANWLLMQRITSQVGHWRLFIQVKDMFLVDDAVGDTYVNLLGRVAPLRATDPRDKLFAVLGLSRPSDRFNLDFQPDYSKTVIEVYTTFARRMAVTDMPRFGNALAEFYWLDPDPYVASEDQFPSWVPRWDRRQITSGHIIAPRDWNVSGVAKPIVDNVFSPSLLAMRGFRVSPTRLVHHGLHKEDLNVYTIKRMWEGINRCKEEGDLPTLDEQNLDDRFVQTITVSSVVGPTGDKDGHWGAKEFRDYLNSIKKGVSGQYESILPEDKTPAQLLSLAAVKKTFFILEDGQIGLGPNATEPEDIACVFYGHRMPYILRPVEDGKFLFLGPCYIHGIMYGEAMKGLSTGKYQEEWLQLC